MQSQEARLELRGSKLGILECGSGRPIVFLHPGDGLDARAPFLDRLAAHGRIIAPSHPGFGTSDLPAEFDSVGDLAYFYLDLFDQLKLRDAVLVGASFGGWIAAEIAIRSCANISQLILIDSVGARFSTNPAEVEIADVFSLTRTEVEQRAWVDPAKWRRDPATLSDEELLVLARDRESYCLFGWSPYMYNPMLRRWLHRISVPTLVLWGEQDRIVAPEYGRRFASAIQQAVFRTVSNAAHFPHIEQPQAVADAIGAFMKSGPGDTKGSR